MGGELSRMAPMELRREETVRAETYKMLLESDAFLHSHRLLRRELCITRMAIVVLLLLLSTTFCLLFFFQPTSACNDKGHNAKANGDVPLKPGAQVDTRRDDPEKPPSATLTIRCGTAPESESSTSPKTSPVASYGNIEWEARRLVGFSLGSDNASLVALKAGTYTVSLQVTYRSKEKVSCKDSIILSHQLQRYTDAYGDIEVLNVYETVYCQNTEWMKSMYSEAEVTLMKKDTLRVQSSQIGLIDCDGKVWNKTFLRVHLKPTG
ncbi:hypothetical protein NFI96_014362 [Prochilodus magdalenae]|nr:hypothetical protein NFI96_014362 [Prochilodus magdalenae]